MTDTKRRRLKRPPFQRFFLSLEPRTKPWSPGRLQAPDSASDRWPSPPASVHPALHGMPFGPGLPMRPPLDRHEQPMPSASPPPPPFDGSPSGATDPPILLYDRPDEGAQQLAALCPSSLHPLPLGLWTFPSVSHLYECASFDPAHEAAIFNHILTAPTAKDAQTAGAVYGARRRPGWTEYKAVAIMRAATALKMALYPPLADLLLATGDRQLWLASEPEDLFWQVGSTTTVGRNEYGRLLHDLRSRLRHERESGYGDVLQAVLAIMPPGAQSLDADEDEVDGDGGDVAGSSDPAAKSVRFAEAQPEHAVV